MQQAAKLYDIQTVFLETEFAITMQPARKDLTGFKSDYLVAKYIKDPAIKWHYLFTMSSPEYYINTLLPIGKDKYMTLDFGDLKERARSILSGEYFRYVYRDDDDEYAGRGCLLDNRVVKNGTYFYDAPKKPLAVSAISDDWKNTIDDIIALCEKRNIRLIFFCTPCSDFCISALGNYDEYYSFLRDFTAARGYDFYDFNLAREKYLPLEDEDFRDDNHLNRSGVEKFTPVFCSYFMDKSRCSDMFYSSYAEKSADMRARIFGLTAYQDENPRGTLKIEPVTNCADKTRITYTVSAVSDGKTVLLSENSAADSVALPDGEAGEVIIESFLDGEKQTECRTNFATL